MNTIRRVKTRLALSCYLLILISCGTPENTAAQNEPTVLSEQAALQKVVPRPLNSENSAPVISALSANPKDQVPKGSQISFTIEATDTDGDSLKYFWHTDKGKLSKREGIDAFWLANEQSGISTVGLTVSDGKGGETRGDIKIFVQPDGQAQVKYIAKEACGDDAKRFVELFSEGSPAS